jgi:hypothetical protein
VQLVQRPRPVGELDARLVGVSLAVLAEQLANTVVGAVADTPLVAVITRAGSAWRSSLAVIIHLVPPVRIGR